MVLKYSNQSFIKIRSNVYCSSLLEYRGDISATIRKPMLDYNNKTTKHIEVNFSKSVHPFFVHRYIKFTHFRDSLKNGNMELVFASPYKWNDPYETMYYEPNVKIGADTFNIACMCCCYDDVESEESAWNRNNLPANVDEKTIKVSFNMDSLCDVLEQYASQNPGISLYFSIVDYSQSKSQLIPKNKPSSYSSIGDYISIMSLKRKAFAYENELRIFAVSENTQPFFSSDGLFKVSVPVASPSLLAKVTLPPMSPILPKDPRFVVYPELQDIENYDLRLEIERILPGVQINQSQLYNMKKSLSSWIKKYTSLKSIW